MPNYAQFNPTFTPTADTQRPVFQPVALCLSQQQGAAVAAAYLQQPRSRQAQAIIDQFAGQPFCSDVKLPPVPSCYTRPQAQLVTYCQKYGSNGPDPKSNSLCWMSMHDPAWWATAQTVPPCGEWQDPTTGGGGTTEPPAPASNTSLVVGGLLAVLAVGGGAVYLATRKKGRRR